MGRRGGVLGLDNLGLGEAGLEVVPGGGTATVNKPILGSLGLHSEDRLPTLTDREGGAGGTAAESGETKEGGLVAAAGTLSGDFSGAWRPGDLRLGVASRGSLARGSPLDEGPGPYLVGEGIFSLESSGLGPLGLSVRPGPGLASIRGSRGDI